MRIEESNIYSFFFPYEGHEITIPVRAQTKTEAIDKLKHYFQQWNVDIAMEYPKTAPSPIVPSPLVDVATPPPDPFALELSIEELVKEIMPIKKPKGAQQVGTLVKEWTGFTYEQGNYMAIIDELKRIKHGK